jgi:radical SAM superfamily enzyme YgiQ (UPF0313 family)
MGSRVLFVSPAKIFYGTEPIETARKNVCIPALTVLGSLKSHGYEVDFMGLAAESNEMERLGDFMYRVGLPDEAVIERIRETKPSAVLITSMFSSEQQVVDGLASKVKESFKQLPVIAGGIHATLKPSWLLESGNIDVVVAGEGEEALPQLLRESNGNYEALRDIEIIKSETPLHNLNRPWALEEVLLKNGAYRYEISHNIPENLPTGRVFPLYYSRGCPTRCDYCVSTQTFGAKIRHMGAERMFSDFKLLHEEYKVSIFYNQADTFGLRSEDIKFLRKVKEYRREHKDFVISNPNAFFAKIFFPESKNYELDEDLLDLLAAAGFNTLTVAVETFNQKYNKKIDFAKIPYESIKELFMTAGKKGMKTELYMMYAFPKQTIEELKKDEELAESTMPDRISWHNCMVFPGTEYYRNGLSNRWFTEESYREALKKGYSFHCLPPELNFSNIPFDYLRDFAHRKAQVARESYHSK